jgi:hypothetical protein
MDFLNKKYTHTRQASNEDEWCCRVPWKETNLMGMRESPSVLFSFIINNDDHLCVFTHDEWYIHEDLFNPRENWKMTFGLWDNTKQMFSIDNFHAEPMGLYVPKKPLRNLGYVVGDSLNMTYHTDTINNERNLKIWRKEI